MEPFAASQNSAGLGEATSNGRLTVPSSVFQRTAEKEHDLFVAEQAYRRFKGKAENRPWLVRSTLDPLHGVDLKPGNPLHQVIKGLLDAPVLQRMPDSSNLGNQPTRKPEAPYFLYRMEPKPIDLAKDLRNALKVKVGGTLVPLTQHSATMEALDKVAVLKSKPFLAVPMDCFKSFREH